MATEKQKNTRLKPRDPDLINAELAMKRAALKVRELARKTGTAITTIKNGIINED